MTNPYGNEDDQTREFKPQTPGPSADETLAYSQSTYAQGPSSDPFPTFGTAEQAADLGAVLVPQDSDTGKVILTYRRWAAEQGILDRDVDNINRFIDLVPPPAGKTPDNVRSILVRWANGEIMLEEQKSKTPIVIAAVAGAAAILIVVAGILFFTSNKNDDDAATPGASSTQIAPPKPIEQTTKAPARTKTSTPKATKEKKETTQKPAPKVTVPNVEGKTLASAIQLLKARGISVEAVFTEDNEEFSGNSKKAVVITTTPGSGTELDKQGASVSIVVQPLQTPTPTTSTTEKTTTPADSTPSDSGAN